MSDHAQRRVERLKRDLAAAEEPLTRGHLVLGVNGWAEEVAELGEGYRVHAHALRDAATQPRALMAVIYVLLAKLERDFPDPPTR
jgi:hypothetical protein